jgi:H+/Cl- antiporter ClcA
MSDIAVSTVPSSVLPSYARRLALALATVMIGVSAGLAGLALTLLLHAIQHLAYGYSLGAIIGPESFLDGVEAAPPLRRTTVMAICGLIAGVGWWAVYRFGRPLVSIAAAVAPSGPPMPTLSTIAHALLQIVTVALGSPLGREVAPREIGALVAAWVARRTQLTAEETHTMIACGASAGLAADYNVPLAGALFTMEVLLRSFSMPVVIPALATSVIGAFVAWIGLGDEVQYTIPHLRISPSLVVWSILVGPVLGFAGWNYARFCKSARK